MTEQDKLFEYILGRISMIESTIMLLWNETPNRGLIKDAARLFVDAKEAIGLASTTSDAALAIQNTARQASFDSMFHELLSESDHADLRKS